VRRLSVRTSCGFNTCFSFIVIAYTTSVRGVACFFRSVLRQAAFLCGSPTISYCGRLLPFLIHRIPSPLETLVRRVSVRTSCGFNTCFSFIVIAWATSRLAGKAGFYSHVFRHVAFRFTVTRNTLCFCAKRPFRIGECPWVTLVTGARPCVVTITCIA